jgi:metallo-beta-lactamase family protein
VGRTQQLVFSLNQLAQKGDIPRLPIYVDSPLAVDATAIYRLHPEVYDSETLDFMFSDNGRQDPFDFGHLIYTRRVEDSKELNFLGEPAIIISASGMAEHGRILHHLKNNIEDTKNTVLIVGWQAEDTLGRKLVEKEAVVRIFGEEYQNRAHCEVLNGFSGHADSSELLAWVGAMQRQPRRSFLVHGEEAAAFALAQSLRDIYHLTVDVPEWKQQFEVTL